MASREQLTAWEDALVASGLPIVGLDLQPARPRIVFAAPLATGIAAERELADLYLTSRRPAAEVRDALAQRLPEGHSLADLHDVWLGAPALPGQVIAADYLARISVDGGGVLDRHGLADAARQLLAATSLPRTRDKGDRAVAYDLRPLLADIEIPSAADPDRDEAIVDVRIRVRFHPERGVGRPEEVVAALAESVGVNFSIASLVRVRVVLATGD